MFLKYLNVQNSVWKTNRFSKPYNQNLYESSMESDSGASNKCNIDFHILQFRMKHYKVVKLLGCIHLFILFKEFMKIVLIDYVSGIQYLHNKILKHFKLIHLKKQQCKQFLQWNRMWISGFWHYPSLFSRYRTFRSTDSKILLFRKPPTLNVILFNL